MARETKYISIIEFLKNKDFNSELIDSEEIFNNKKVEQEKSGLYVKLSYKCSCGNVFSRDFATVKRSLHNECGECSRKRSSDGRRRDFSKFIEIIEKSDLKYVSGEINNSDSVFTALCSCGEKLETSIRIIKNSGGVITCKKCRNLKKRNTFKTPFKDVKMYFDNIGCELLSDESEYLNHSSKLTYIAKCGHINSSPYVSFTKSKHKLCKECLKKVKSGENAYNWKGGVYDSESVKFRKTYEFKKWRRDVFKRDNYTCQICGSYGGRLNAHHLDGYNWCEDRRTDVTNGVTMCEKCHNDFHNNYGRGHNTLLQYYEYKNNVA